MNFYTVLYATIKNWELAERLRREDFTFCAFEFLSKKIGHKNSSTLRKMCEPRSTGSNAAKLGLEEAIVIMSVTNDYRLLQFVIEELKRTQKHNDQLDLFCQPLRDLSQIFGGSNSNPERSAAGGGVERPVVSGVER